MTKKYKLNLEGFDLAIVTMWVIISTLSIKDFDYRSMIIILGTLVIIGQTLKYTITVEVKQ